MPIYGSPTSYFIILIIPNLNDDVLCRSDQAGEKFSRLSGSYENISSANERLKLTSIRDFKMYRR
jgi:hypothetical protein